MEKDYKLVIEFMDWGPIVNDEFKDSDNWSTPICAVKSWNYIMPVVEACYHNGADSNQIGDITHALLDCNLEATFKAVVEFIKQYNQKQ